MSGHATAEAIAEAVLRAIQCADPAQIPLALMGVGALLAKEDALPTLALAVATSIPSEDDALAAVREAYAGRRRAEEKAGALALSLVQR